MSRTRLVKVLGELVTVVNSYMALVGGRYGDMVNGIECMKNCFYDIFP